MITLQNVTKTFGDFKALDGLNLHVPKGAVYGLVGPNGAGKSTLFSIVTGEMLPDSGEVVIPKDFRLGIMRQHIADTDKDRTLLEFTADAMDKILTEMEQRS